LGWANVSIVHHKLGVHTGHATKKPREAAFRDEVDDEAEGFRLFLRPVADQFADGFRSGATGFESVSHSRGNSGWGCGELGFLRGCVAGKNQTSCADRERDYFFHYCFIND